MSSARIGDLTGDINLAALGIDVFQHNALVDRIVPNRHVVDVSAEIGVIATLAAANQIVVRIEIDFGRLAVAFPTIGHFFDGAANCIVGLVKRDLVVGITALDHAVDIDDVTDNDEIAAGHNRTERRLIGARRLSCRNRRTHIIFALELVGFRLPLVDDVAADIHDTARIRLNNGTSRCRQIDRTGRGNFSQGINVALGRHTQITGMIGDRSHQNNGGIRLVRARLALISVDSVGNRTAGPIAVDVQHGGLPRMNAVERSLKPIEVGLGVHFDIVHRHVPAVSENLHVVQTERHARFVFDEDAFGRLSGNRPLPGDLGARDRNVAARHRDVRQGIDQMLYGTAGQCIRLVAVLIRAFNDIPFVDHLLNDVVVFRLQRGVDAAFVGFGILLHLFDQVAVAFPIFIGHVHRLDRIIAFDVVTFTSGKSRFGLLPFEMNVGFTAVFVGWVDDTADRQVEFRLRAGLERTADVDGTVFRHATRLCAQRRGRHANVLCFVGTIDGVFARFFRGRHVALIGVNAQRTGRQHVARHHDLIVRRKSVVEFDVCSADGSVQIGMCQHLYVESRILAAEIETARQTDVARTDDSAAFVQKNVVIARVVKVDVRACAGDDAALNVADHLGYQRFVAAGGQNDRVVAVVVRQLGVGADVNLVRRDDIVITVGRDAVDQTGGLSANAPIQFRLSTRGQYQLIFGVELGTGADVNDVGTIDRVVDVNARTGKRAVNIGLDHNRFGVAVFILDTGQFQIRTRGQGDVTARCQFGVVGHHNLRRAMHRILYRGPGAAANGALRIVDFDLNDMMRHCRCRQFLLGVNRALQFDRRIGRVRVVDVGRIDIFAAGFDNNQTAAVTRHLRKNEFFIVSDDVERTDVDALFGLFKRHGNVGAVLNVGLRVG